MSRVLYISSAATCGGAEVVLLSILSHIDRRRFQPEVVVLDHGELLQRIREELGVAALSIPAGRFRDVLQGSRVVRRLQRIIRDRRIDLVHANGTLAHLYGGMAARVTRVPSIYHLHDLPERSWTRQGLVHRAAARIPATAVVAVSQFIADQYVAMTGSRERVHVIHNGAALCDDARDSEPDIRSSFDWPSNAPLIVWCGRLQQWKGAHVFLDAAARIHQQCPAARFLVIGGTLFGLEPDYARALRERADRSGLGECLKFTGHVPDPRPFVQSADVVVHSSIRPEPFGLVVLEAMALKKAVVAAAAGGPTELICHGISGELTAPGDPDAIATAVLRLIADPDRRRAIGVAARNRIATSFGISSMIGKLEALYDNLERLN